MSVPFFLRQVGKENRLWAQAFVFVFVSEEPADSPKFAETHRQLWSWGGVPLVYRVTPGLVQLFRCAHKADFLFKGRKVCKPHKILKIASNIANDRWWDIEQILNGSLSTEATQFFEVLTNGPALVNLLDDLERRFNGHVFTLSHEDRETLGNSEYSTQLTEFARMVEGKQEANGQLTLWERYSFADLPVEIISHIYQLFVKDSSVAVYTPPFLVRFMLGEVLSWDRLDRLERENEVILAG